MKKVFPFLRLNSFGNGRCNALTLEKALKMAKGLVKEGIPFSAPQLFLIKVAEGLVEEGILFSASQLFLNGRFNALTLEKARKMAERGVDEGISLSAFQLFLIKMAEGLVEEGIPFSAS